MIMYRVLDCLQSMSIDLWQRSSRAVSRPFVIDSWRYKILPNDLLLIVDSLYWFKLTHAG